MAQLNAEINKALALPDVARQLAVEGAVPTPTTPKAYGELIARDPRRARAQHDAGGDGVGHIVEVAQHDAGTGRIAV